MKILVILISFFISYSAISAENRSFEFTREQIKTINVVAPMWEDYTNASNEGIQLKPSIVPWNRAMKMVTKYQIYNAIVGEYRDTEEALIFPRYPIDVEYLSVLTKNQLPLGKDSDHYQVSVSVG